MSRAMRAWVLGVCSMLSMLAAPAAFARELKVLVMGDSLSAAYGLRPEQGWVTLADAKSANYTFHNASVSGETTAGGRSRFAAELQRAKPDIVIIELGANDGLRGLPVKTMRDNLAAMAEAAQKKNARVLIVGQRLPPNYGPYATQFHEAFAAVAKEKKTALVDFLLDGVATRPELFQADNLHPTAEAQPMLLDTVWQGLAPLLK